MKQIVMAYRKASKRLLLFDYDGTLVPFTPTPEEAKPTRTVLRLLSALSKDPKNTLVVISGRTPEVLDAWLEKTGAAMAAEHGHFLKMRTGVWRQTTQTDESWKRPVRESMDVYTRKIPGSFVEEKHTSLVWHYRTADAQTADEAAKSLHSKLQKQTDIHVTKGAKIVEARQPGMDKGSIAQHWITGGAFDFILAAGDDTTDEDMFTALPGHVYTVKIGPGATAAKSVLSSPEAFVALLEELVKKGTS